MAAIPKPLALALRDLYDIRYAVETGTYKMWGTAWLAEEFLHVWTIEMDEKHYQGAIRRSGEFPNVKFMHGDSRQVLPEALAELDAPALLWLDAHWCGGASPDTPPEYECPLEAELRAVRANVEATGRHHFIFIDDARCFMGRPEYPHRIEEWPSLTHIIALAPPGYVVDVYQDAIICLPAFAAPVALAWRIAPCAS